MSLFIARRASGVLAALFVAAASAHAATVTSPADSITGVAPPVVGVVQDTSGAPLPNARVSIASLGIATTTNGEGRFTIASLRPGRYHITAQLIGYAPAHQDVVVAVGGEVVNVTITLHATALSLSGVVVTATPMATDPLNVPQATTELSGDALARRLSSSVAQTLAEEPGISVRYNGPAASAPVIRGLQGDRILVLQDGQRTGDLSSAAPDHAVSLDPLAAERIEVVRGPASLLYGNNALGGVVNVISNDIPLTVPSHLEGYLAGQAESVSPGGALSGALTIPAGQSLAITARGGWRDAQDVRQGGGARLDNTYSRNYYGVGGLGFSRGDVNVGAVYRGYKFDYGLPSAPGDDEAGVHIDGHRQEVAAKATMSLPGNVLSTLDFDGTAQWYSHDEIEASGEIGTSFRLDTRTLDLTGKTRLGPLSGAVGVSGLFKRYSSTGEEALTPAANSNAGGIFLYQELPLVHDADPDARVPRLQVGGRYDLYRIASIAGDPKFGAARKLDFDSWSGSIGMTIPIGENVSFGASAARAFRAPTVEELFSNAFHAAAGTYDQGNPDLKAETSRGLDGVLRVQSTRVDGQLAAFYNRIADYVTVDIAGDTTTDAGVVPLNRFAQSDATLKGVEGKLEVTVLPQLVLGVMGDVVRGELKDGTALPFIPAARLGGSARWKGRLFSLGGELRHGFAQRRVPPAAAENDPSAIPTDAYTVLDLSAGFDVSAGGRLHSIMLRVDNVTDEQYLDATSRIKSFALQPGRNVALVYKVAF
jgi:iron complex outermembrane receptor protein